MEDPVQATLMYFARICDEKNEMSCFDMYKVKRFFKDIKKDYEKIFSESTEEDREYEIENFRISRIINSINHHPYFISPNMSNVWFKRHEKKYKKYDKEMKEIAQRFYDELGCNLEGRIGERTKIISS